MAVVRGDVDVAGPQLLAVPGLRDRQPVWRPRIGARRLRPDDGTWSTMQIAAAKSDGRSRTTRISASTPPAEAPMPTTVPGAAAPSTGLKST